MRLFARIATHTFAMLSLSVLCAKIAVAQACEGNPSYRTHPISIGAGVSRAGRWSAIDGGVGAGYSGVYGGIGGGYERRDRNNPTTPNLSINDRYASLHLGYERPIGRTKSTIICPIVSTARVSGPTYEVLRTVRRNGQLVDVLVNVATKSTQYSYGVAVGTIAYSERPIKFIPSAQFAHIAARTTIAVDGAVTKERQDFSDLQVAFGFNFFNELTVQPWANLAVGLDYSTPTYGLNFRYSIPRK